MLIFRNIQFYSATKTLIFLIKYFFISELFKSGIADIIMPEKKKKKK